MRLSWKYFDLWLWLKFLVSLVVIALLTTYIQVILAPYQNQIVRFDGQIGDFYADQVVADHNITNTQSLLATPNCVIVPSMTGSLSCLTSTGTVQWQTILSDAPSQLPMYLSLHRSLLVPLYGGGIVMLSETTGDIIFHQQSHEVFNWKQVLVSENQQYLAFLNTRNQVFVFDTQGKLIWKTPESTEAFTEPKTKIFIHEDKIFVADAAAYTLTCLEFTTGTQLWRQHTYTGDTTAQPEFTSGLVWFPTKFYTWQGVSPATGRVMSTIAPPPGSTITNLGTQFVFHNYENKLYWFDAQSGQELAITSVSGKIQKVWFETELFVKVAAAPFSEKLIIFDWQLHKEKWISETYQIIKDVLLVNEKTLVVASLNGTISWLDKHTGKTVAQVKTPETALMLKREPATESGFWLISTHHGNFGTIKELVTVWFFQNPTATAQQYHDLPVVAASSLIHHGKLWMIDQSQLQIVALTPKSLQSDQRFFTRYAEKTAPLILRPFQWLPVIQSEDMTVSTVVTEAFQGCIVTTTVADSKNLAFNRKIRASGFNPWTESSLTAKLIHNNKLIEKHTGYYYLPEKWRVGFLAPQLDQETTMRLVLELTVKNQTLTTVSEVTIPPNCAQNFLSLSSDKNYLQAPTEPFFWGMGIQDVAIDSDNSGSFFDDWQYGLNNVPDFSQPLPRQNFRNYLKTFRQAGFSIFRISQDNFSYKNWLNFQNNNFVASLHTGLITDEFLKELRAENYRVIFGIFGFAPETESQMITAYLDYCIARFGPWIDVWELSNEAWPSESWVTFVSNYLRTHDPYQHPITTSWDRSHLSSIDIVNLHYYRSEPTTELTAEFLNQIISNQGIKKPIIFGEFGNSGTNWDDDSAERLRIKSWLSAWHRVPLVIWNQSATASQQPANANLYLGPIEREVTKNLVSWLGKYEGIALRPFSISTTSGNFCSGLTNSTTLLLIYCTNSSGVPKSQVFTITEVLAAAGITNDSQKLKISWSNPKTLKQITVSEFLISKTAQTTAPAFATDLVGEWALAE